MHKTTDGSVLSLSSVLKMILLAIHLAAPVASTTAEEEVWTRTHELSEKILERKLLRARAGDASAQLDVAKRFETGKGCTPDGSRAYHWYLMAAQQGLADAQYRLALLLQSGKDVEKDDDAALRWLSRAAEQGHPAASARLTEVEKRRAEAREREKQRLARASRPRNKPAANLRRKPGKKTASAPQQASARNASATRIKPHQQSAPKTPKAHPASPVLPVPVPPAVAAPPAPKPEPVFDAARLLASIKSSNWQTRGVAVDFFPSRRARCVMQGDGLVCFTGERDVLAGEHSLRYMVRSTITTGGPGDIVIRYRFQVTRVRDRDDRLTPFQGPDQPEARKGWQQDLVYHCKTSEPDTLDCETSQGSHFELQRAPSTRSAANGEDTA